MLGWITDSNVVAIVGWLGLLVSLAGLGLTVAVYRSTSAIRQAFLISARVPKQLEELRLCATAISEHLAGADLHDAGLRRDVIRLGEIASSIREKIAKEKGHMSTRLTDLLAKTSQYEANRTREQLTEIYVRAQGTCEAIDQWLQDRDWRTHNGN